MKSNLEVALGAVKSAATALGVGGAAVVVTDLVGGSVAAKVIAGSASAITVGMASAAHDVIRHKRETAETNAALDGIEELLSRVPDQRQ